LVISLFLPPVPFDPLELSCSTLRRPPQQTLISNRFLLCLLSTSLFASNCHLICKSFFPTFVNRSSCIVLSRGSRVNASWDSFLDPVYINFLQFRPENHWLFQELPPLVEAVPLAFFVPFFSPSADKGTRCPKLLGSFPLPPCLETDHQPNSLSLALSPQFVFFSLGGRLTFLCANYPSHNSFSRFAFISPSSTLNRTLLGVICS